MLRTGLFLGSVAVAGWLTVSGLDSATAQQPVPAAPATAQPAAVPAQPGVPATPAGYFRAKSILGSKVLLQGGATAGTVEDMVLSNEGVVDYLIVMHDNKYTTVPWTLAKFNFQQRTATVNVTPQVFQAVPTFTLPQYPNFYTPTYRTEIYKAYNMTPGQERRLERRIERRQNRQP
jgi:hypothetical protein